jgi:hypothetical protein
MQSGTPLLEVHFLVGFQFLPVADLLVVPLVGLIGNEVPLVRAVFLQLQLLQLLQKK